MWEILVPCLHSFLNLLTQQALNPQPTHHVGICLVIQDGERTLVTCWAGAKDVRTSKEDQGRPLASFLLCCNRLQLSASPYQSKRKVGLVCLRAAMKELQENRASNGSTQRRPETQPWRVEMSTRPEGKS